MVSLIFPFGTTSFILSTGICRCFQKTTFFQCSFLAENAVQYDEIALAFYYAKIEFLRCAGEVLKKSFSDCVLDKFSKVSEEYFVLVHEDSLCVRFSL